MNSLVFSVMGVGDANIIVSFGMVLSKYVIRVSSWWLICAGVWVGSAQGALLLTWINFNPIMDK